MNKVDILRKAGFSIYWLNPADIAEIRENGYVRPYYLMFGKNPAKGDIAYVDLGSVARGEDNANQTSTVLRSNYRSLRKDYPITWIDTLFSNVDSLGAIVTDLPEDVIEVLVGLNVEYPLYDDQDLNDLEQSEITDSWNQYHKSDICSRIIEMLSDDGKDDVLDKFYEMDGSDIDCIFWQSVQDTDCYPEHNGLDVIWTDSDILTNRMIDYICGNATIEPDTQGQLF